MAMQCNDFASLQYFSTWLDQSAGAQTFKCELCFWQVLTSMLWRFSPNSPVFSLDKRENNFLLPNCYLDIRYFFITINSVKLFWGKQWGHGSLGEHLTSINVAWVHNHEPIPLIQQHKYQPNEKLQNAKINILEDTFFSDNLACLFIYLFFGGELLQLVCYNVCSFLFNLLFLFIYLFLF